MFLAGSVDESSMTALRPYHSTRGQLYADPVTPVNTPRSSRSHRLGIHDIKSSMKKLTERSRVDIYSAAYRMPVDPYTELLEQHEQDEATLRPPDCRRRDQPTERARPQGTRRQRRASKSSDRCCPQTDPAGANTRRGSPQSGLFRKSALDP
jgi:hypothetical protein